MTYGFEERDYSLDKFEDSFTPEKPLLDLSGFRPTTPLVSAIRALGSPTAQAGYRGIASGLSLGLEVTSDDDEVKDQTIFDYIVDGAAERAAKMRIDNEDFAKKQGLGGGIAYGLTYGLSGFFGTFGNPALYGQGLASARTKSELAAGVDPATAQKIGAIEGVTGAVGSVIPFFGKTLVQRLGFGAAANIIPGIGQRAAEGAVFGDRYASRTPEVFDPVAITVDALLGGSFGYLAGIADKPSSIPDQDINDALDLNVKVKQADSAPGMPNETSFAIHNKIMDEMVAARREYRQPDFRALADAEFKDSPEQIRQMQEALDEIEAWRGDDGEVKMMPSEASDARKQIEPMYNRVLTDLEKTGRYTPEQSQQFAKLTSRVYRTLSKRTGMDVDELEAQFPLKTVMGSVEGVVGLGQSQVADKDLFVGHNISEEGIKKALELGGLAAPSLGISRTTTGGFEGYGGITLLADKSLLETRGARTFNADVYSPRQPRPTYKLDSKSLSGFMAEADAMPMARNRAARQIDEAEIQRYGAEALARIDGVQMLYLSEIGQLPKPKRKAVDPIVKQAAKLPNANQSYNLRENPEFQKLAKVYFENLLAKRDEAGEKQGAKIRDSIFEEDGSVNRNVLDSFARDVQSYVESGGLDFTEYRAAIAKKFRTDAQSQAYSKWLESKGKQFITGKQLQVSPSKKVPYTLENVVEQMTKEIRGGEGFNYGAGNIRAMNAAEITSIQEIKNRREEIVSAEDFKRFKDESQEKLMTTLEELKPFYKYDAESWGYINDASSAIAEGPKGWKTAFRMTAQSEKIIRGLVSYLKNLPTEYFETKMQRAVGFGEFKMAVVPKGTAQDVIDALTNAGVEIKTYDPKKDGGRNAVIAKAKELLFQTERGNYNPATQTINLSEISDPSTFVHELGHHLFEMLGKLAANPKAPKQIQDDFRALVEHGGMKVGDWYTASLETRRNAHERVAEDFETYLMDGSAPTPELKTMFGMIRDWMLEVYKTISGQVKPEIKAVFDRMLATDEQLAMKVMTPDYAAIAKRTEATKSMTLDNYLEEAKTTLDPESTVTIEGKPVKVADLLEDDPIATQEATGMKKLVECMLNVR